ncbi:MAG: class I SAM-dependent methyltransferase [Planctomyces sp.]|nr:class I SAM-dependent methyltransferase [Planctomyces sp.]
MFTLDKVVPWGRSFDEYQKMFAFSADAGSLRILGCGDGPASFNCEATHRGWSVVSCDPIYRFDVDQLRERIAATSTEVLQQARQNAASFVWDVIRSVEELGKVRMAAMNDFLKDFPDGRTAGRYVDAELPFLPFDSLSFDLAICSHLLFLYTNHLGLTFHLQAIREMCRVAREARIFPLVMLSTEPSPFMDAVIAHFGSEGFDVSVEQVPYEFQRGGNKMLRIRHPG